MLEIIKHEYNQKWLFDTTQNKYIAMVSDTDATTKLTIINLEYINEKELTHFTGYSQDQLEENLKWIGIKPIICYQTL